MAGPERSEDEGDGEPVAPDITPPWIRRDRNLQKFAARIAVSVTVGVSVAALGPSVYALQTAPDIAAIAAVPPAQWPECKRLTRRADGCWYRVANRSALTITDAAGLLGMPVERLQVMNPQWINLGTAPQRILIWRGDIAGGGQ